MTFGLYLPIALVGWLKTEGTDLQEDGTPGTTIQGVTVPAMLRAWFPLAATDLVSENLTPRPADWKPFELWLRDLRRAQKKDGRETDPEQDPLIPTAEEIERWRLRIAALDAPVLGDRDLRGADMGKPSCPAPTCRTRRCRGRPQRGADAGGNLAGRRCRGEPQQRADAGGEPQRRADAGGEPQQRADAGGEPLGADAGGDLRGALRGR